MYKKLLATAFTVLLLVATLAYAATNMQVTASAVPVSGGTITPNGIKFYSATQTATYVVAPKAGWSLTSVLIDGVVATAPYTVPYDVSKVHTVKANFAQALYTITTTGGPGGTLTVTGGGNVNITPGSARSVVVAPNTGYQIATLTVDGTPVIPANPTIAYTQDYTNIQASKTVSATFNLDPAANTVVNAGTYPLVGTASTTLTGTATSLVTPIIYQWALVSGPSAATFGTPTAVTTTFNGLVTGTYNVTLTANGVVSAPAVIRVDTSFANPGMTNPLSTQCITCHAGSAQVVAYSTSVHAVNNAPCAACHTHGTQKQCATCHSAVGTNNALAFLPTCTLCHVGTGVDVHGFQAAAGQAGCVPCHGGGDAHKTKAANGCIGCHDINITYNHGGVADNNTGVRAITTEFTKWSHHVTGVTLNNAHCVACHLEGKVNTDGQVAIDDTYHMATTTTHLRNADTDADMQWDPAAPNHSTMDNFCMSCHDANGATSAGNNAVQAYINNNGLAAAGKTASASNPFGDTISNRYDKMQRPAVVDASSQFDTTNNSHHAVKGAKYTGRTRAAGTRQIASAATFAANSSATLYGARSTIYDAGNFNQLYVPLVNAGGETAPRTGAATLGDDSTLHCGDCHTVGQFKPNATVNAAGTTVATVIGAHGSNNEYLLRNSIGTDARHTQNAYTVAAGVVTTTNPNGAFLVCFNCHAFNKYGSAFNATGAVGGHAGEYASGGRCNGPGNTLSFNGYTSGAATDGTQFSSRFTMNPSTVPAVGYVEQNPDFGNIYGIQCANCHNSGVENGYGGIHGSKVNTYTDGMGMVNKMIHFLPGLGNSKYVPGTLGGFSGTTQHNYSSATSKKYSVIGDVSNDTNWEQKQSKPNQGTPGQATDATGAVIQRGAGCYTLSPTATAATFDQKGLSVDGGATIPEALDTWGGCEDHGAAVGAGDHGTFKKIVRPVTY